MTAQPALTADNATRIMREGRVFVAGAGVAGRGIMAMLNAMETDFQVIDDRAPDADLTVSAAIEQLHDRSQRPDLIITSPGWRPDSPLFATAAAEKIAVIGDIEAAWLADKAGAFGAPRTWIAITGTNGKTTATAMTTAMFEADHRAAMAVGNIGTPPGEALVAEQRADYLIAEVSSFQLHWAPTFEPDSAVVLNIAEDHLDWHGSMAGYVEDKFRVFRTDRPVIPVDEPEVLDRCENIRTKPAAAACSIESPERIDKTAYDRIIGVSAGSIVERNNTDAGETTELVIASAEGISPPGPAGIADAVAATALARNFGIPTEAIARALGKFEVQAHRGQVVLHSSGIDWIDNSKATNPHATIAALRGLDDVVWIAGGQLKGADVKEMIAAIGGSLKAAVLLGVDREILAAELDRQQPDLPLTVISDTDPAAAMEKVVAAAAEKAEPGDKVILAPAAASLDMYSGMAERGTLFERFAHELNETQTENQSNTPQTEDRATKGERPL